MTFAATRDQAVPDDVARLLASVPEWFGQPESNAEYIQAARSKETWTVRNAAGTVLGVLLVDRHYAHSIEIHLRWSTANSMELESGRPYAQPLKPTRSPGEFSCCRSRPWGLRTRMQAMRRLVGSMKVRDSCRWRKLTSGDPKRPA